jgi:hypothetical protein
MMKSLGRIYVEDEQVELLLAQYADGSPAIVAIVAETGEPYGKLSVNLAGRAALKPGEITIKTDRDNTALAAAARRSGLFIDTRKRVPVNFVEVEIWRLR